MRAIVWTADPERACEAIRAGGLRLTRARRALIEALFRAPGPVSAEQIAAGLDGRAPEADTASVYRNLERLERIGLLRQVFFGDGPRVWALADRIAPAYTVCERCGEREGVGDAQLAPARAALREATGFEASFAHFPVMGLCATCTGRA
ncbi:transcriptional repressor [Thermoleophilia bacterium SCSIO 60948]|nr:transcriptional repressor [Thermoleophilia bacterium SCSIO 60948]